MPPILHLPVELISLISQCLDESADLSSWSRSCRAFHAVLAPQLYRNVKDDPFVMLWACEAGRLSTVQRLLAAGADSNTSWTQHKGIQRHPLRSPHLVAHQLIHPDEDYPLSRQALVDASEWLFEHAAMVHDMPDHFEEKNFYVDMGNFAPPDLDLVDEDDILYETVKTFPQR